MKTRLLDAAEFKATFAEPMRDVAKTATDVIDVWPYVSAIPASELANHEAIRGVVEHVYRNGINTFDHVLVATKCANVYLAVIVDLVGQRVLGHHLLDLNFEYGLGRA